jgi:hypothetical protein
MNPFRSVAQASICLCLAFAVSGCRDSGQVAVHPVSGKVMHRGEPAVGAKVVLYAVDRQDPTIPFPTGVVESDGSFRLTSYQESDGAPAGKFRVAVSWPEPIPAGENAETFSPRDRLRDRYSNPEKSGLEVTIVRGENVLEPFELK